MSPALAAQYSSSRPRRPPAARRRRSIRARVAVLCASGLLVAGGVLLAVTLIVWQSRTGALTAAPVAVPSTTSGVTRVTQYGADRHELVVASLIALVLMAALALVLGWLMGGRFVRPLRAITATTREISAANLHARLHLHRRDDEFKELADTLDQLLERIERSFTLQRQFIANASHELRTPIAAMRASLDVAMAKPGSPPAHIATLADRLGRELEHAARLLDSLLSLAQTEHVAGEDEAVVSLRALTDSALERHADAVAAMGLRLDCVTDADAWVRGDETLLARMVHNVIDNAIVHNQAGGWLRTTITARDNDARLVVENGGPRLDGDQVASLTRPFVRLGAARTGSDTGSGLGLAIVASVAEAHGGAVALQALAGGGLGVAIALPLVADVAVAAGA